MKKMDIIHSGVSLLAIAVFIYSVYPFQSPNPLPVIEEYNNEGVYKKIEDELVNARPKNRDNFNRYKLYPLTSNKTDYKKTASRILANGYTLRDNPAIFIDRKINWNPVTDDVNWHFKINSWHPISQFFNLHDITGDPAHLHTIKPIIFDWINDNIVNNIENDKKWYDMATGTRAVYLAYFFNHYPLNDLSNSEYFNLLVASSMHVDVLANPALLSTGNHGFFQLVGLKAICTSIPEIIHCNSASQYADRSLKKLLDTQITEDGIHKEHSTQYHPWIIEIIEGVLATGLFPNIALDNIQRAKDNIPWMFYPNGRSIQFGDSDQRNMSRYQYLVGDSPSRSIKNFIKSGYSFYRDTWDNAESSYLAFAAAYHSRAHKQADDLSFVWYDRGQEILTDSGKYTYSSGPWRDFFNSTRAHNTVEIDDRSNKLRKRYEYGSALKTSGMIEEAYIVTAELDRESFKTNHQRQIALIAGKLLIVIDWLSSPDHHSYKQWFHLHPGFERQNNSKFFNRTSGQPLHYAFTADTVATLEHMRGEKDPEINGWVSYQYQQKIPRSSLAIATKAKSSTMVSAFSLIGEINLSFDQKKISICTEQANALKNVAISLKNDISLLLNDKSACKAYFSKR